MKSTSFQSLEERLTSSHNEDPLATLFSLSIQSRAALDKVLQKLNLTSRFKDHTRTRINPDTRTMTISVPTAYQATQLQNLTPSIRNQCLIDNLPVDRIVVKVAPLRAQLPTASDAPAQLQYGSFISSFLMAQSAQKKGLSPALKASQQAIAQSLKPAGPEQTYALQNDLQDLLGTLTHYQKTLTAAQLTAAQWHHLQEAITSISLIQSELDDYLKEVPQPQGEDLKVITELAQILLVEYQTLQPLLNELRLTEQSLEILDRQKGVPEPAPSNPSTTPAPEPALERFLRLMAPSAETKIELPKVNAQDKKSILSALKSVALEANQLDAMLHRLQAYTLDLRYEVDDALQRASRLHSNPPHRLLELPTVLSTDLTRIARLLKDMQTYNEQLVNVQRRARQLTLQMEVPTLQHATESLHVSIARVLNQADSLQESVEQLDKESKDMFERLKAPRISMRVKRLLKMVEPLKARIDELNESRRNEQIVASRPKPDAKTHPIELAKWEQAQANAARLQTNVQQLVSDYVKLLEAIQSARPPTVDDVQAILQKYGLVHDDHALAHVDTPNTSAAYWKLTDDQLTPASLTHLVALLRQCEPFVPPQSLWPTAQQAQQSPLSRAILENLERLYRAHLTRQTVLDEFDQALQALQARLSPPSAAEWQALLTHWHTVIEHPLWVDCVEKAVAQEEDLLMRQQAHAELLQLKEQQYLSRLGLVEKTPLPNSLTQTHLRLSHLQQLRATCPSDAWAPSPQSQSQSYYQYRLGLGCLLDTCLPHLKHLWERVQTLYQRHQSYELDLRALLSGLNTLEDQVYQYESLNPIENPQAKVRDQGANTPAVAEPSERTLLQAWQQLSDEDFVAQQAKARDDFYAQLQTQESFSPTLHANVQASLLEALCQGLFECLEATHQLPATHLVPRLEEVRDNARLQAIRQKLLKRCATLLVAHEAIENLKAMVLGLYFEMQAGDFLTDNWLAVCRYYRALCVILQRPLPLQNLTQSAVPAEVLAMLQRLKTQKPTATEPVG